MPNKLIGTRVPLVRVGEMVDGHLLSVRASDVVARGRSIIVGVPAAFSPVCSGKHLPSLVRNVDRLLQSGFEQVICVVSSDPYATEAWAKTVDPARRIRFLADGNLHLTRALGLQTHEPKMFLGECSQRYMLMVRDGVIESARVEEGLMELSCTDPDNFVLEDA